MTTWDLGLPSCQPSKSGNAMNQNWDARVESIRPAKTRRAKHFGFEATIFLTTIFESWQLCSPLTYMVILYHFGKL